MIRQVRYRREWPAEFVQIGLTLRAALGDLALRIDHIGSTSVPGLAAQDVVDVQITARRPESALEEALHGLGYSRIARINSDHVPPGQADEAGNWTKWIFCAPAGQRATNRVEAAEAWAADGGWDEGPTDSCPIPRRADERSAALP